MSSVREFAILFKELFVAGAGLIQYMHAAGRKLENCHYKPEGSAYLALW